MKITKEYEDFFYSLADKYELNTRKPHLSSGRKYFQIYPKTSLPKEGTGGAHYEFNVDKGKLFLSLHLESNIKNRPELKRFLGIPNPDKRKREYDKVDLTDSNEKEIEISFLHLIEKYENKINQFYLLKNKRENVDSINGWKEREKDLENGL